MKIEAGFLKKMFSYPESAKKIRYKTKVEVNNKIKEITKYCIEEQSPLDPDSEDTFLKKKFLGILLIQNFRGLIGCFLDWLMLIIFKQLKMSLVFISMMMSFIKLKTLKV